MRKPTTKRSESGREVETETRTGVKRKKEEKVEEEEEEEGGEVKKKLEVTQEKIYDSSEKEDAQKHEEEERGLLPTLTPEVMNMDEETKLDCNRKMDGTSDWSGRG